MIDACLPVKKAIGRLSVNGAEVHSNLATLPLILTFLQEKRFG